MTDPTPLTSVVKPEFKQVTNYLGAAVLGAAGYVVANPEILAVVIPAPWGAVVLAALGAGLMAYREKSTSKT